MTRSIQRTLGEVRDLRDSALALEALHAGDLERIPPRFRESARNLLHYLGVRQHDIRTLQQDLQALGLSSLGIIEAHVLASLNAVIANLERLDGLTPSDAPHAPADFASGPAALRKHANLLLGPSRQQSAPRIMVTMPSEAATDEALLADLLRAGMDVMRINCAHDDVDAWRRMAENLRRAEKATQRQCRIQADLAGPKMRTGSISPVGHFLRIRPARDLLGRVTAPAQAWLVPHGSDPASRPGRRSLPMPEEFLAEVACGDRLRVEDLRGKKRTLDIVSRSGRDWRLETDRSIHVGQGARCVLLRDGEKIATARVGALPAVVEPILLRTGDLLDLTRADLPGMPATIDEATGKTRPARIHCTLASAFERVAEGDRVWLDDGKIGGRVVSSDAETIRLAIDRTPPDGAKLRAEKGINFPDMDLGLSALTDKDREDLRAVAGFADIVALSFLRTPDDLVMLQEAIAGLDARHLGVVLKIETAAAFRNLPRILLSSLRSPPVGVMVARGDLAVEVGFERLSELQEEILWLAEAAHVPVIWATQVLEGLAKTGAPSRAEVSDAVMGSRAECVMLNKGPRIVETAAFLADVIGRMESHHDKRMALLRKLTVSNLGPEA